jgi:hypothetical protein
MCKKLKRIFFCSIIFENRAVFLDFVEKLWQSWTSHSDSIPHEPFVLDN